MPFRGDNPFEEIEDVIDRVRREFEPAGGAAVPVDVEDRGDEIVVTADLPGYDTEDVDVTLANGVLRIAAERETMTEEDGDIVRRERRRTSVDRSVRLPDAIDAEGVEATHTNGVLTVTLPKADADDGTTIQID